MDNQSSIRDALHRFVTDRHTTVIFPCKVLQINENNGTIDVQDIQADQELYNVRLRASIDNLEGVTLIPKIGSTVLVGAIGNSDNWVVLTHSEVSKVVMVSDAVRFEINSHFLLKKNNDTLGSVISDFINAIQSMTVMTAQGPSSVPINSAAFTAITARLNALLQ
jgi:hypothetical protein